MVKFVAAIIADLLPKESGTDAYANLILHITNSFTYTGAFRL